MIFCESCGKELKSGAKFCEHCGATVLSQGRAFESPAPEDSNASGGESPEQPAYQAAQQGSYTPPAQPRQGGYIPPTQQQQGSYVPPAQAAQGSYSPPQQAQGGYTSPVQQQGGYAPPVQQGYAPQAAYAQSPMQKQKKPINKKLFIFGGGALALVLIIVLIVSLLGGKGDTASNDPNVGMWNVVSAEMWGFETDISDIFEKGFSIELLDKGKCKLNIDGTKGDGKWTFEDGAITIKGSGLDVSGTLKNGVLVLEDVMGMGLNLKLQKEGPDSNSGFRNPLPYDYPIEDHNTLKGNAQAKWNGSWYGYLWITEAYGEWADVDELFDAYMVIDVEQSGEGTMAIFIGAEENQTVDSYIFADENHFEVTDGVFWDMELDKDVWWLALSPVDEGSLVVIADTYIDPELADGDGFEYMFCFRPFGELWESEEKSNDLLPPGYQNYASAIRSGVKDPNAFIGETPEAPETQNESNAAEESETGFAPNPDKYGKEGWAYNSTATIRMRIPDGWEISRSLNEKNMSVRSAAKGGDTVTVSIESYSDSATDQQRSPSEQVKKNASDEKVFTGTWGNAEVWYRLKEWGDYNQIAGFAAYDANRYIYFDVRIQKANVATAEEFMKSAAWKTIVDSFERDVR